MIGIYCYEDTLNNNEIVYVGKDSNISTNLRHRRHHYPSRYHEQKINQVLQNNPNRYKYRVLKSLSKNEYPDKLLDVLEIIYIRRHHPIFNFTIGGDGGQLGGTPWNKGKKMSEEFKLKISKAVKGKNHPLYGTHRSEETKKKISIANGGENSAWFGKHHTMESIIKKSKKLNSTGFLRVNRIKNKKRWKYQYYDDEGNRKRITRKKLSDLEKEVKSQGLDWIIIDEIKAQKSRELDL